MLIISTTYDSESAVLTENKISYVKMYLKLLRRLPYRLRASIFFSQLSLKLLTIRETFKCRRYLAIQYVLKLEWILLSCGCVAFSWRNG